MSVLTNLRPRVRSLDAIKVTQGHCSATDVMQGPGDMWDHEMTALV